MLNHTPSMKTVCQINLLWAGFLRISYYILDIYIATDDLFFYWNSTNDWTNFCRKKNKKIKTYAM